VFLGKGDGTFQPEKTYPASHFAQWIVSGDFFGDGHIDLVTGGDLDNDLSILRGNGDGYLLEFATEPASRDGDPAGATGQ
jgi:hypothetical protein